MKNFVILILVSLLFLPELYGGVRLEDLILLLLFAWLMMQRKGKLEIGKSELVFLSSYVVIISLSSLYNLAFFKGGGTWFFWSDSNSVFIKEIIRVFKYFLIVLIVKNMKLKEEDLKYIAKYFVLYSFILCIVGIMQRYNTLNINQIFFTFFQQTEQQAYHNAFLNTGYTPIEKIRINGTFYVSNTFAAFLLIPFSYSLKKAIFDGVKKYWLLIALIVVNIFLTQSRTGIFITVIIFGVYLVNTFSGLKLKKSTLPILFIAPFLIIVLINAIDLNRLSESIDVIFSYGIIEAANRGFVIQMFREVASNSFLLGFSPFSDSITSDNELIIFMQYGGILGVILYTSLIIGMYFSIKRTNLNKQNKLFLNTMLIIVLLVGLTNGFVLSNRLFSIYLIIHYLFLNMAKNESSKITIENGKKFISA